MIPAQLHASSGSGAVISGEFYALSLLKDIVDEYPAALEKAMIDLVEEEKGALTDRMGNHPDWGYLEDKAYVSVTTEGLEYGVADEIASDLEYGNPQKKIVASGLLRSTAKRRSFDLGKSLMDKISKGLPDA